MQRRYSLCSVFALSFATFGTVAHAQSATVVEQARAARFAQEPDQSVELLAPWLCDHPEDADAWLENGFALTSLGEFSSARLSFGKTLEISPGYADAKLALARLDFFEGQYDAALSQLAGLEANSETRAFSDQVLTARSARQKQALLSELTTEFSELSHGQSDWSLAAVSLSRRVTPETALGGMIEHTRRFNKGDLFVQIQADHAVGSNWSAYAGLGGTVDADFRPRTILYAGTEFGMLKSGSVATSLDGRLYASVAEYVSGQVVTLSPGLTLRFKNDTVRMGARLVALSDESGKTRYGQVFDAGLDLTPQLGLRGSWSDAPETSDGQTIDVNAASLSLRWSMTNRLGASIGAISEERPAYDRAAVSFSLSRSLQ